MNCEEQSHETCVRKTRILKRNVEPKRAETRTWVSPSAYPDSRERLTTRPSRLNDTGERAARLLLVVSAVTRASQPAMLFTANPLARRVDSAEPKAAWQSGGLVSDTANRPRVVWSLTQLTDLGWFGH